ncbi:MAG TPA: hypothetical protein VK011_03940 [Acidimicrobiia bacterium]|nr:hypothetical protein [Acidimicrobiia bacterium]
MSHAPAHDDHGPHGLDLLPRDLTPDELAAAPTLATPAALVIEELSAEEDEAFAAALSS